MSEQYLPINVQTRLKNLCLSCDTPPASGFNSQSGENSSSGKSLLATGNSTDTINATTIETINLIAQNTQTQIINGDVGQFYTLEVVELRGFRATGDIDFNGANMVNINIDSGTLDNVLIGGDSPADAYFENFYGVDINGDVCFEWNSDLSTLNLCNSMFIQGAINFGSSGTNIVGDGTDLFTQVIGTQFIANFNQNIGVTNNKIENIGNSYEIEVGNTYSLVAEGPISMFSKDNINLETDGCLNITADCLNMDIKGETNLNYNTLDINVDKDYIISVSGNKIENILGTQTITIGSTSLWHFDDYIKIEADNGLLLAVSGLPLDIYSQKCINITSENCINIDAGTTMKVSVEGDYLLSTSGDIKLYAETKAIRLLEDSCIYIGEDVSICGASGSISINSLNDIVFNVSDVKIAEGGNLSVDCLYLGTSNVSICGDGTDMNIFITGCLNQDINCANISVNNHYNINSNDINLNSLNDINLNSLNDINLNSLTDINLNSLNDINLNTTGCLNITANCLNIDIATTSMLNYDKTVITTFNEDSINIINGEYNVSVDGNFIITGTSMSINTETYNLNTINDANISVDGEFIITGASMSINTDTYNLNTINDANITSLNDINFKADGCINFDSPCINIPNLTVSGSINVSQGITIAGGIVVSGGIDVVGDYNIPSSIEQQWVKYNDFETIGTTQAIFVTTERAIGISGAGEYYWNFCYDKAESFYLAYDITQKIREAGNKGFQLQSIHPYYEILNDNLNNISINVIKHSLNSFNPLNGRVSVPLDYDETELILSLGIGKHYPSIGITSDFLSSHESIMVEFCFDKKINSDIHFYGMTVEFITVL